MKLVLFDVDNTLIRTPKSHIFAFLSAIKDVYGIEITLEEFKKADTPGLTDPEILFSVLADKISKNFIEEKLLFCLKQIEISFPKYLINETLEILPGVKKLLEILIKNNTALGIVTGNLESIAWKKLKKANIDFYFSIGAFGSDLKQRADLVKLAIKRAKKHFNQSFDFIYLIGDTPRDVAAGKKVGINTIAVATGNCPKEVLKETEADLVVENLLENKLLEYLNVKR
ncbi:MAG: HAD hydrolase-like protein [Candidatus Desulfofervidus auxilii]|nr:HAD hydrolase-like protein [Candidatus Desulfofervidus auxilii]